MIEEVKTPFDYLNSDINGTTLADAYRLGHKHACQLKDAKATAYYAEMTKVAINKIREKKDTECQQRVERIFREIEKLWFYGTCTNINGQTITYKTILESVWQALKKKEGIE